MIFRITPWFATDSLQITIKIFLFVLIFFSSMQVSKQKVFSHFGESRNIFDHLGIPNSVNCDNEEETMLLQNIVKKIKLYFSDRKEINNNAIAESLKKTIAQLLQKYRTATNCRAWYKLPDVVENYNSTMHRTIKKKPVDTFNGEDTNHQKN